MKKSYIRTLMSASMVATILAFSSPQSVSAKGASYDSIKAHSACSIVLSCNSSSLLKGSNCFRGLKACIEQLKSTSTDNTDCKNISDFESNGNCESGSDYDENTSSKNTTSTISKKAVKKSDESKSTSSTKTTNTTSTESSNLNALEKEVLSLVNKERAKVSLPGLKGNAKLSDLAKMKSKDMIDKNYFSHNSPTYGSVSNMLNKFNVKYSAVGENIASGYPSAQAVVSGWMRSPGHRANILNKSFTEIGIGAVKDSNGKLYWTQIFIRPLK